MSHAHSQGDPCAAAHRLNRECACVTVDQAALHRALQAGGLDVDAMLASRPHLFSNTVVYVGSDCLARMAELVAAMEDVVALPAYQQRVLAYAPALASQADATLGAFLGYDFHLAASGPRLIEINTNAGGGLLNTRLLRAQRACAAPPGIDHPAVLAEDAGETAERRFLDMFRAEWRRARGNAPLRCLAIVDEAPAAQFLAPEFELFRQLFAEAGVRALIVDSAALVWEDGVLSYQGQVIDLVYNRLTDFALAQDSSTALRSAWLAGGVVLTPHPRAHALYADKRNLALLSDPVALAALEVPLATQRVLLACIPRTVEVRAADAEQLWRERRQWFFKPAAGFGSRAAYRGDKLTRRVFEEILAGSYIAQQIVPPSERRIVHPEGARDLKLDLRCYAYAGQVQLTAARLYQGQTTNFRTPGGGFAAVVKVGERTFASAGCPLIHTDKKDAPGGCLR